MASTTILSVKSAIVSTLEEVEALAGVKISAGKEPERADEYIWIPEAKSERSVDTIRTPPTPLLETVKVSLWVVVIKGTGSPTPAEERAHEVFAAAETALRALSDGLGEAKFGHWIESVEPKQVLLDNKWAHHIKAVLLAKARI